MLFYFIYFQLYFFVFIYNIYLFVFLFIHFLFIWIHKYANRSSPGGSTRQVIWKDLQLKVYAESPPWYLVEKEIGKSTSFGECFR